jgi:hypothetical protein
MAPLAELLLPTSVNPANFEMSNLRTSYRRIMLLFYKTIHSRQDKQKKILKRQITDISLSRINTFC